MIFNKGQEYVVNEADQWYNHSSEQVFQFSGGPGRGKTTVLLEIIRRLNIPLHRIACMSYIGQAAINMRTKGLMNAKTIHSWYFTPEDVPVIDEYGNVVMNTYLNVPKTRVEFVPKPLTGIDLIIIDEAGSTPHYLKEEIESRGIKIIATGDLDQLPPVGDKPAYLYTGKVYYLTENMRQKEGSGIIYLSDRIIQGLPIHKGLYGDVLVIERNELTDEMILNSDVILCGKNATRDALNYKVRTELLKIDTDFPIYGERMVCRKNNWNIEVDGINLANGLCGIVDNYPSVYGFNGKTLKIDFKPFMMNTSFRDLPIDYKYLVANHQLRQMLKNDKYAKGEKFEYAYGITTHMSQGSQYANGIYIQEYLSRDIQKNLDYTGVTRFVNSGIYVIPSKRFF